MLSTDEPLNRPVNFMKNFYLTWNAKTSRMILEFFSVSQREKLANLSKGNNCELKFIALF